MANSSSSPSSRASPFPSSSRPSRPASVRLELSDFLLESRNSPEAHKRNFEEAQREHERVLKAALDVFELHRLAEETRRIELEEARQREIAKAEQRRIEEARRLEAQRLADEARLQALKAKPIPKPAPSPTPAAPPSPGHEAREKPSSAVNGVSSEGRPPQLQGTAQLNGISAQKPALAPPTQPQSLFSSPASTGSNPFLQKATPPAQQQQQQQQQPQQSAFGTKLGAPTAVPATTQNGAAPAQQQANGAAALAKPAVAQTPKRDRYIEVHQKLKELRKFMAEQAKSNKALSSHMGDMRREIRKSIGQLTTGGLKENRMPVGKIAITLRDALQQSVPSMPVDPNEFLLEPRAPVEGASHNEAQLPSLYIYLLNQLAKLVIKQLVREAGANTRTADPLGQVVAKVFSEDDFLWRGKSMIDILIAKYRVVCPVLFGFTGNDDMEGGRARVGWWKEDGLWIPEQSHIDRMTGLGAGFAAITLRDFSKVKRLNPWPPTAYWMALAKIVNTPAAEISRTQCYVLKAMVADYEQKFIHFYGNAAVAALRCALIDFPSRMPKQSSASQALTVQAKTLGIQTGLRLDQV